MSKNYGIDSQGQKVDITRGDLVRFYPGDLLPMRNYRFGSFDSDPTVRAAREQEIEDMVASLIAENQKQPISIHEVSGSRFQVHSGDTRHQAALRIDQRRIWPHGKPEDGGRMRIECRVENFAKDSAKEVFGSSIVENLARNNLTPIDVCIAVAEAERLRYTDAEIMAKFRQTDPAFLPNMRRLARLPDPLKRQIHLKQMAASVGYVLAEIPEEAHAAVLAEVAGGASRENYAEVDPWDLPVKVVNHTEPLNVSTETLPPAPITAPAGKTRGRPKGSGKTKITARAVATAARNQGHLKHKKIAKTIADIREYWEPFAEDRNSGTRIHKLAEATLSWLSGSVDDDRYYQELLSIFKEIPK